MKIQHSNRTHRERAFPNFRPAIPRHPRPAQIGPIPPSPHPRLGPGRSVSVRKIRDWMRRIFELIEKTKRPVEIRMDGTLLLRVVPSRFGSMRNFFKSKNRMSLSDDDPFFFRMNCLRTEWVPNYRVLRQIRFVTEAGSIKRGLAAWRRSEAARRGWRKRREEMKLRNVSRFSGS